ncbi:MAG: GxxExxY protein [Bacteroidota bacterium]
MRQLNNLTQIIIGKAIDVHKALGPGLLESAYQKCLIYELKKAGLEVEAEKALSMVYKEVKIEHGYRIDILVNKLVVLELKHVENLTEVHRAQVLTYMKFGKFPVGLLINFNVPMLKNGIKRFLMKQNLN